MSLLNRQDREALERFVQAFSACPRPEHFTNFKHCEECAAHDETLLSRTAETLTVDDVGNPGWDPICFISPAGFAYMLPGLARLALDDSRSAWYGTRLFWHLVSDGPSNERYMHCSKQQRSAVAEFLAHLIETKSTQIEADCAADDAMRAFEIWSGTSSM